MKIGLSITSIHSGLSRRRIDGIGAYTQHLLELYQQLQQTVVPILYPLYPSFGLQSDQQTPEKLPFYVGAFLQSCILPFIMPLTQKIEAKIDVFHATDHRIPRLRKTPVVATLHDAIFLKHPEWCNTQFKQLKDYVFKRSAQWADCIITVSRAVVPDIVEYWGVDEKKIEVVHCGLGDEWSVPVPALERAEVLKKYKLRPNFLLYVGTLQPRKNISRIIQAYQCLSRDLRQAYPLVLVGQKGWREDLWRPAVQSLLASGEGVWLDYVPVQDLHALYQSASIFVFPSLSEGFGLPVLEAFASGVPVITSNTTSLPEVAGDAAYLVDPSDIEALKTAMEHLLTDQGLYEDLKEKGFKRAKQFSWQRCAEETLALYQKCL